MPTLLQKAHSLPIQAVVSTSSNLVLTESNKVALVDATSGAITITLPEASNGLIINVKKVDSSANTVTIQPPSGTIDGSALKVIYSQYDSLSVTSDGTNFYLI